MKTELLEVISCLFALIEISAADVPSAPDPISSGRPLAFWIQKASEVRDIRMLTNQQRPEVSAIRAMGTNAIPWLLQEMSAQGGGAETRQLLARAGFWALGDLAEPAIPSLLQMLDKAPTLVPNALAGIGPSAIPALKECLAQVPPTPRTPRQTVIVEAALGGLFVAIDAGRISQSDGAQLLPLVQSWARARSTNPAAAYWANGVVEKLGFKSTDH
jgi:hypothetical protein